VRRPRFSSPTWGLDSVAILTIALIAVLPGCQSISSDLAMLFGDGTGTLTKTPAPSDPSAPKYFVELREDGKQSQLQQFPLTGDLYVQQVLQQSGALQKFRRIKVEIYRQLPGGGGHRLDIPFDRAKRQVPPGRDYAIHPGDRIVVTKDTSTILDDMLESLGGPFSGD
jgi:hypothetical protein